jgi:hypothetical protein
VVFDRFLARVVDVFGGAVVLNGGLVLEMRLGRARTTRDIDLALSADPTRVLARLQEAGRIVLPDFMTSKSRSIRSIPRFRTKGWSTEAFGFAPNVESQESCTGSGSESTLPSATFAPSKRI